MWYSMLHLWYTKTLFFGFWQWFLCPIFKNHSRNKNPKYFFFKFPFGNFFWINWPYFIIEWCQNCCIGTPQMWDSMQPMYNVYHNCRIVYLKCGVLNPICGMPKIMNFGFSLSFLCQRFRNLFYFKNPNVLVYLWGILYYNCDIHRLHTIPQLWYTYNNCDINQ